MENIDNLDLYIEELDEDNGKIKRFPLDRDLENGESAYTEREKDNKISKIDENKYIFHRFNEIQSHIEDYESEYKIEDVRDNITYQFDYKLEYSNERVEYLEEMIEDNDWIYDLLSSNRMIKKEQKKKNNFLAEDQKLDGLIQRMADYILHPKFNNEDSEDYFKGLKEDYDHLKSKKGKTNAEIAEMMQLKDEVDLFNQGIITKSREQRNNLRESSEEDVSDLKNGNSVIIDPSEFTTDKSKVEYVGRDLEIYDGYWKDMNFSEESRIFREEVMNVYEESLNILVKQLGNEKSEKEKEHIRTETMKKLGDLNYTDKNGTEKTITAERRLKSLDRMYSELKSDHYRATEILATPISFTQVTPSFTKYDFNYDTWYIDENGEEVEVSKNSLLLSDVNTYKGLIANYYDLKDKYRDDFHDDMWAILLTFENLIEKTEFSKEEKFVVRQVMNDSTRKEIIESYNEEFNKVITMYTLSRWINNVIPNKILNTYLLSLDDWLYTFKLKGKFKQCSKCKKVKLINTDKYFRKHPLGRDGFRSQCKKCESLAKTPKQTS